MHHLLKKEVVPPNDSRRKKRKVICYICARIDGMKKSASAVLKHIKCEGIEKERYVIKNENGKRNPSSSSLLVFNTRSFRHSASLSVFSLNAGLSSLV